jgi:hypothetical protein
MLQCPRPFNVYAAYHARRSLFAKMPGMNGFLRVGSRCEDLHVVPVSSINLNRYKRGDSKDMGVWEDL